MFSKRFVTSARRSLAAPPAMLCLLLQPHPAAHGSPFSEAIIFQKTLVFSFPGTPPIPQLDLQLRTSSLRAAVHTRGLQLEAVHTPPASTPSPLASPRSPPPPSPP